MRVHGSASLRRGDGSTSPQRVPAALSCALLLCGLAHCACPQAGAPCQTSADCPAGQVCAERYCRAACNSAADCSSDEACLNGACLPSRPGADAATTDAPMTDAPMTDAPMTDTPMTDTPMTDAPMTDAPMTDAAMPDALLPDAAATPWQQNDFAARQRITLHNSSGEALRDFPVLLRLETGCLNLGQLRADRADLLFEGAAGEGVLAHEIDYSSTTALHLWVKVPSLRAGGDTALWLYYNNPAASSVEQPSEVWSDSFRAVWHMGGESGDRALQDSTGNGNRAQLTYALEVEPGKAGTARRFAAGSQVEVADQDSLDLASAPGFTLEGWVQPQVIEELNAFVLRKPAAYSLATTRSYNAARPELILFVLNGSDNAEGIVGPTPLAAGDWAYLAATYDDADHTPRLYVDGVEVAAAPLSVALDPWTRVDSTQALLLGPQLYGLIDELRISALARSPAWIATQHAVMQGQLVSLGACEARPD